MAGSEVADGDEPGADEGRLVGFGALRLVALKDIVAVALLVVVVLMRSPFGPILSSTLGVPRGG